LRGRRDLEAERRERQHEERALKADAPDLHAAQRRVAASWARAEAAPLRRSP
jgi:hypothetical protein